MMKAKMFKSIAWVLCGMLAVSSLTACGGQNENKDNEISSPENAGDSTGDSTEDSTSEDAGESGSGESGEVVTITISDLFPDKDTQPEQYAKVMERVEEFEKLYPNVKIEDPQWTFSVDTFLTKAEAGTLPTLYYVPFTEAKNVMDMGYAADLTEQMEKRGYKENLDEMMLEIISKNNKIYFMPDGTNYAVGIAVNLDLYRQAGYVSEDGTLYQPETWEELAEVAKKIKDTTGVDGFMMPTINNQGGWRFTPIAWSYGTVFETKQSDGSWQATFDSPECAKAMQFISDLKWKYDVLPENILVDSAEMRNQFSSGNLAMTFAEPNFIDQCVYAFKLDINNVGMLQIPAGDARRVTLLGGGLRVIDANATPEQIEAAMNYLVYSGAGCELTEEKKESMRSGIERKIENGLMVGLGDLSPWKADSEYMSYYTELIDEYRNVDPKNIERYNNNENLERQAEEPVDAQALYAVLDNVIQEVLTNKDADIEKLLKDAADSFQKNNLDYAK